MRFGSPKQKELYLIVLLSLSSRRKDYLLREKWKVESLEISEYRGCNLYCEGMERVVYGKQD